MMEIATPPSQSEGWLAMMVLQGLKSLKIIPAGVNGFYVFFVVLENR
jgi:hypothetical protein